MDSQNAMTVLPACTHGLPLVVLGASSRGLAESAGRAGWSVHAADLFCDLDLIATAREAVQVPEGPSKDAAGYPWSLHAAAAGFPVAAPWCYTGALENHPELIDAIASARPLAGNAGAVVRRLRTHGELAAVVHAAGLSFPETRSSPDRVPLDGSWLVKPLASAGGRGICRWTPQTASSHASLATARLSRHVWQHCATGAPFSAAFCMGSGSAQLLGVSRQLIGEAWCHAGAFAWCGGITHTPAELPPVYRSQLDRLAAGLVDWCQPVGLLGIDLVVDPTGRITVIEVNPRATASMELFERAGAISIAGVHLAACGLAPSADSAGRPGTDAADNAWAKSVLFAAQATAIDVPLLDALRHVATAWTAADGGWAALADIPRPGQVLAAAAPVLTLFARGHTADQALACLRGRAAIVDDLLARARRENQPAIRRGSGCSTAAPSET